MIDRSRDKLIHAMLFFIRNTSRCNKLKLFKLLYFADFEHFRVTGKSITGLEYYAWPMGPVPNDLYDELDSPQADMKRAVSIVPLAALDQDFAGHSRTLRLAARIEFDEKLFSRRELKILQRTAEVFKEADSKLMTEASHMRNHPWDQVFNVEKRKQAPIPYLYILDDRPDSISKDEAELRSQERQEIKKMFG